MSANDEVSHGQSISASSTPHSLTIANLTTHQKETSTASLKDTPMQRWLAYTDDRPAHGCKNLGQGQQTASDVKLKKSECSMQRG